MGLLDLFKKKQNVQNKTDGSIGDKVIKLAEAGMVSVPKDDDHNSLGESLDHLVDGELPWGWSAAKADFIRPRDKKLLDLHVKACEATSVSESKEYYEKFLDFYQSYKEECRLKGECYIKYFSDMHENCHVREGKKITTMYNRAVERLDFINAHFDELIEQERLKAEQEQLRKKYIKDIDSQIENIIRDNPGILQSELVKRFDPIVKNDVSEILYSWAQEGRITREKKGRSYTVALKD